MPSALSLPPQDHDELARQASAILGEPVIATRLRHTTCFRLGDGRGGSFNLSRRTTAENIAANLRRMAAMMSSPHAQSNGQRIGNARGS